VVVSAAAAGVVTQRLLDSRCRCSFCIVCFPVTWVLRHAVSQCRSCSMSLQNLLFMLSNPASLSVLVSRVLMRKGELSVGKKMPFLSLRADIRADKSCCLMASRYECNVIRSV
jgi:hypothetical protein